MPLDSQKIKTLYDYMRKCGYDGDYNTFHSSFVGNENFKNRYDVYKTLTSEGANIGRDYAEFMQLLQSPKKVAPATRKHASVSPQKLTDVGTMVKDTLDAVSGGGRQRKAAAPAAPAAPKAATAENPYLKMADDAMQNAFGNTRSQSGGIKGYVDERNQMEEWRQEHPYEPLPPRPRQKKPTAEQKQHAAEYGRQLRDQLDYTMATGGNLNDQHKKRSPLDDYTSPYLKRDEQGNLVTDEQGNPVVGITGETGRNAARRNSEEMDKEARRNLEHRLADGYDDRPITGFWESFKQGASSMWEGVKYLTGYSYAQIFGGANEERIALDILNKIDEQNEQYIPPSQRQEVAKEQLKKVANDPILKDLWLKYKGDTKKIREIVTKKAEKEYGWGDRVQVSAKRALDRQRPTEGFLPWAGNLAPQMIPSLVGMGVGAATKNPTLTKAAGAIGMGVMTASTAGMSMKDARDEGATNGQVWAKGILDGIIEYATEKIPFDRYTKRLVGANTRKVGKALSDAVGDTQSAAHSELGSLLTRANAKLGGKLFGKKNVKEYLADVVAESASEFTAEALETITGMIYLNPEDYPTLSEIMKAGLEGAAGGAFMGGVMGGISKAAENAQNRARWKKNGYVYVGIMPSEEEGKQGKVVEIVGYDKSKDTYIVSDDGEALEVKGSELKSPVKFTYDEFIKGAVAQNADHSYDIGYETTDADGRSEVKTTLDMKREEVAKELGVNASEVDGIFGEDPIDFINRYRYEHEGEDAPTSFVEYANARASYEGTVERVKDDVESEIEAANAEVSRMQHMDDGSVRSITIEEGLGKQDENSKKDVHLVSGKVFTREDGTIDKHESDKQLIIYDGEQYRIISIDNVVAAAEPIDGEVLMQENERNIRAQWSARFSAESNGELVFDEGSAITVLDEEGQPMQYTVCANEEGMVENEDGTVNVTDGINVYSFSKEALQQMSDESRRAAIRDKETKSQRDEESESHAYGVSQFVVVPDSHGMVTTATIIGVSQDEQTGETIYDVEFAQPMDGQLYATYTQSQLDDIANGVTDGHNIPLQQNAENKEEVQQPAEEQTKEEETQQPQQPAEEQPMQPAEGEQQQKEEQQPHQQEVTALSRIPVSEVSGEPDFTAADKTDAVDALMEMTGGDTESVTAIAMAQIEQANADIEKLKAKKPTPKKPKLTGSPMQMLAAQQQAKQQNEEAEKQHQAALDEAERLRKAWTSIYTELQGRLRAEKERQQQEYEERQKRLHEQAVEEEKKRREEERAAAEQREKAGFENPMPNITERWNSAKKFDGDTDEITLPDGTTITGHYVLHEAGAATPSHDPHTWKPSEGFPMDENGNTVNDRDYEHDADARRHTEQMAQNFDQRAAQEVPVVSQEGVVLSGNGRTMAGILSAEQGTDVAYNDYLRRHPGKFGFTSEQVEGMQHPRVSFVPDDAMPYNAKTFARFNKQAQKSQNKTEQAVKLGKTVGDDVFGKIVRIINGFDTLGDFYGDAEASLGVIGMLRQAGIISDEQVAEMVDGVRGSERLSTIGREFLENMLIGKAFQNEPDVVRMLTAEPSMRRSVIIALGEIADNVSIGEQFSLQQQITDAIKLCYEARRNGVKYGEVVSPFATQGVLFTDEEDFATVADFRNAATMMLADVLNDERVTMLKTTLALYNAEARKSANGEVDMFTDGGRVRTESEILKDIIHFINTNYGRKQKLEEAKRSAAERRKADGQTDGTAEVGTAQQSDKTAERTTDDESGGEGSKEKANGNNERGGNGSLAGRETGDLAQTEVAAPLSDEVNEFGKPFVQASDGSTTFGEIPDESGLKPAPIKLSIGENYVDDSGSNHGYGYLHIVEGHGEQIRAAGFNSIEEFVETVAKNYDTIREGGVISNNQTYLVEVSDEHNNTLFIQLSRDGNYWNVNSAGIFKKKYSRRKPKVYTQPALEPGTNTDSSGVNSGKTEGVTAPAGNSPKTSSGKDTDSSQTNKTKSGKVSEKAQTPPTESAGTVADSEPLSAADLAAATDEESKSQKDEETKSQRDKETESQEVAEESKSKWVNDEDAARFEELRRRLRSKLGGQMNMGADPEIFAIGVEMAYLMLKKGSRKFSEFASNLIEALGDSVRPYVKSFYNGARDLPEMEEFAKDMTPYEEVRSFDIANFDREGAKDLIKTAETIATENKAEREAEVAVNKLKQQRNERRKETEQEVSANTEDIASQAEAVAGEVESELPSARNEREVNNLGRKIDDAMQGVNEQLALLGYYEAEHVESDFNEAFGYMRNAEKKAAKNVSQLFKTLTEALGIKDHTLFNSKGKKIKNVTSNIAPAGGEVSLRIPLNRENGVELYMCFSLNPADMALNRRPLSNKDDLELVGIMYRLERKRPDGGTDYLTSNDFFPTDVTISRIVNGIRNLCREWLPKEDYVAMAHRIAAENADSQQEKQPKGRKSKKKTVSSQEYIIPDLFSGLLSEDELNSKSNDTERTDAAKGSSRQDGTVGSVPADRDRVLDTASAGRTDRGETARVSDEAGAVADATRTGIPGQRSSRSATRGNNVADKTERGLSDGGRSVRDGVSSDGWDADRGTSDATGSVQSGTGEADRRGKRGLAQRGGRGNVKSSKQPEPKFTRNYLYPEDASAIDNMTPQQRLSANVEALEVVRTLMKEGREATSEEREILGKYRGWGGVELGRAYSTDMMRRSFTDRWGTPTEQGKLLGRLADVIDELDPNGERGVLSAINRASLTSYYTPTGIAKVMNRFAELAGFKGGSMLDPSMGNGVFEGTMSKGVQHRTMIHGIELDWLTGQIARNLYPDANVLVTGYEQAGTADNAYDVVMSNIPFGSISVTDKTWKHDSSPVRKAAQGKIHNYFAVKMLDNTRPGGLCVIMTSNAILDTKGNQIIREHLADQAEVLGVVRLPDNTFKGAGTSVVTDVIFLRKYKDDADRASIRGNEDYTANIEKPFLSSGELELTNPTDGKTYKVAVNGYFTKNKGMMIGDAKAGGQYRSDEFGLSSSLGTDELANAMSKIVEKKIVGDRKGKLFDTHKTEREVHQAVSEAYKGDGNFISSGNIVEQDGMFGIVTRNKNKYGDVTSTFNEMPSLKAKASRIRAMLPIREAMKELIASEIGGTKEDVLKELRNKLQDAYDAYVNKFGHLNNKENDFLTEDIDGYTLRSLEKMKDGKFAGLSDIFTKNTIKPALDLSTAKTPQDAISLSLAEYGEINPSFMENALGASWAEQCGEILFRTPFTEDVYETSDAYLSGDVKTKLEQAREAAKQDKEFERNVEALEAVQPKDIPFDEISIRMGARWIPADVYTDFMYDMFGIHKNDWKGNKSGVEYMPEVDQYVVNVANNELGGEADAWRTSRRAASEVFTAALQDKSLSVFDTIKQDGVEKKILNKEETELLNNKIQDLRTAFEDWLSKNPEREEMLMRMYNDKFNRTVLRKFDGSHLNVAGLMGKELRPHQKDAVWMLINNRGGIVDHIVGAGKTLVMQSAIMEMRRMGIAKKPMIIGLKATVAQIAKEFREAYPAARILAPTEKDFAKENRKKFMSQIALNDYDCVILSHDQYDMLPHTEEVERGVINEQMMQLDAAIEYLYGQNDKSQLTKKQIKGLEKRKANLEAKLEKLLDRKIDREFTFEGLGVDYLFVDECQHFKSLPYVSTYERVAGLGDKNGSQRAIALLNGVRYLQRMHQGDRGTVFLSGTTISNSLSEIYHLLNYLRPSEMERLGMTTFDAWASNYAIHTAELEYGVTNELKEKDRFRSLTNIPELSKMYAEIADVRNDMNLKLPKPKMRSHIVTVPQSDLMKEINSEIVKMVKNKNGMYFGIDSKDTTPWGLLASTLSAKVAINPRLIDESYDSEGGKIPAVCENVKKIYDQFAGQKGTQLIFCDTGVPGKGKKYDAYSDIINRLVNDYGIPRKEIADIHEAGTDEKRKELFAKVNDGSVRILIGGTKNMGTGVNVQKRIVAMHHVDVPWTPADREQREGRGVRQGNEIARDFNDNNVDVYFYATEGSLDMYKYQLQETKGKLFAQFKSGTIGERTFDEGDAEGDFDPAEVVAMLSGNPVIFEKSKQDKKVEKLRRAKRAYESDWQRRRSRYEELQTKKRNFERLLSLNSSDVSDLERGGFTPDEKGKYPATVTVSIKDDYESRRSFDKPKEAGEYIHSLLNQGKKVQLSGFNQKANVIIPITDAGLFGKPVAELYSYGGIKYSVEVSDDDTAAGVAFRNLLQKVYSNRKVYERNLEEIDNQLNGADPGENKFPKQAELDEALKEKKRLDDEYKKLSDEESKPTSYEDTALYRIREDEPPTKTGIGYKVFVLKNGKLYPPMVANPGGEATPVGVWLDADAAPVAGVTKTGRQQVKAGGRGTQGGSGSLAYRPGWHLGTIPYAIQFNRLNPETGEKTLFPRNFVWAEVEYADDVDYQDEAMSYGMTEGGKFRHAYAGLPRVPENGSYTYRTNPNPETDPWVITGAMRVNRILKPSEVDAMVEAAGRTPQQRQDGAVSDAEVEALNDKILNGYREGEGAVSDDYISWANDPVAKMLGELRGTKKSRKAFAERERARMENAVRELAKKLGLKNVEIVTDASQLEGKKKNAKGFFSKTTGKITIVIPNHTTAADAVKTLLHEAVAHYGLRRLFGEQFDTFLDKVYENSEEEIQESIRYLAEKHGLDLRTATEEYLATLAEMTDFETDSHPSSWLAKVKEFFIDMLHRLGIDALDQTTLTDNELQYILWRSYKNLEEGGAYDNVFNQAKDISMQHKLKVGNYEESEPTGLIGERNADGSVTYRDRDAKAVCRILGIELNGNEVTLSEEESQQSLSLLVKAGKRIAIRSKSNEVAENGNTLYREGETEEGTTFKDEIENLRDRGRSEAFAAAENKDEAVAAIKKDVKEALNEKNRNSSSATTALRGIRSAMSAQKAYDMKTVDVVVKLAKEMMDKRMLDNLSTFEVKRILSAIQNSVGKGYITKEVDSLLKIMTDNQLRMSSNMFQRMLNVKGGKVNAKGVEVQGKLDLQGQKIAQVVKRAIRLPLDSIQIAIADAEDRMGSEIESVAEEAATEMLGLKIAQRYVKDILGSQADEDGLRKNLKQAKEEHDAGLMTDEAYREYVQEIKDSITDERIDRSEAYRQLIADMAGLLNDSAGRAKEWRKQEKERVQQIHHYANSDLQGKPAREHGNDTEGKSKFANFIRNIHLPLGTFEQYLTLFGQKDANGKGYLKTHFLDKWQKASDEEYKGTKAAKKMLDEKVSEIFDKKKFGRDRKFSDLFQLDSKFGTIEVAFMDGGEMVSHTLSHAQVLYIYMVNKMSDGRMKLRKMGITEDVVEELTDQLTPEYIELADWIQAEFLPSLREKYNATYERMFGAPMPTIDNYFPLKILGNAINQEVDMAKDVDGDPNPSIITGAIIKRRRNTKPLDLMHANAFDLLLGNIQEMEKWSAYAEFNRDLSTLLSYNKFKNRVKNMRTIYGSGDKLWRNFFDTCRLVSGVYRDKESDIEKFMNKWARGGTTAKIAFRVFTAIKQLTSLPAFWVDTDVVILHKNLLNPKGSWDWCMENLPNFDKRWNSRMAGDPRLLQTDMDWQQWRSKTLQMATRYGMSPNAFVDCVTVAIGARSVYETKKRRYLKQGYSEERAEEKAKMDATQSFNLSQQSSEAAYISPIQQSKGFFGTVFTMFRNSPFSYTRQVFEATRALLNKMRPGYKEESIEFTKKKLMREEGFSEEHAEEIAIKEYNHSIHRDLGRVSVFGFILPFVWNLSSVMPYLFFGDDDEEKEEMFLDALKHAAFGPIEGLLGGDVISYVLHSLINQGEMPMFDRMKKDYPIVEDMEIAAARLAGKDWVAGLNDVVNILVSMGFGFSPQSLEETIVATLDYFHGDMDSGREAALLCLRIINAPQSQTDNIYFDEIFATGEEASKMKPIEIIERYARYKRVRQSSATGFLYSDERREWTDKKYRDKGKQFFVNRLNKKLDNEKTKELLEEHSEIEKRLQTIRSHKQGSEPSKYREGMRDIREEGVMARYNRVKRYKKIIDKMTNRFLRAKDPKVREDLVKLMMNARDQMLHDVELIDAANQQQINGRE